MMLVVLTAFVDASVGANAPMSKRDKLLFATFFVSIKEVPDTTYTADSVMQIGSRRESFNGNRLGLKLIDGHLRDIPGVERLSLSSTGSKVDVFLEDKQFNVRSNYTDAAFWKIYDFDFIAGQGFSESDVASSAKRVVLGQRTAESYFGLPASAGLGQTILLGDTRYEVVGIVAPVRQSTPALSADAFIPYTTVPLPGGFGSAYDGQFTVVFEAGLAKDRDRVVADIEYVIANLEILPEDDYTKYIVEVLTPAEEFAAGFIPFPEDRKRALKFVLLAAGFIIGIVMFLPALNLVNVNLGRVFERAPEIAVRKSFGASRMDIVRQFLLESLLITVIGGTIGSLLALVIIAVLNSSGWLGNVTLAFTPAVALWTVVITLAFSLLTGLLPAVRMAQTHISTSLR